MTKLSMSKKEKSTLKRYLEETASPELINSYLRFLEVKHGLSPVLFPREKTIFQGIDSVVELMGNEGKLWKETEIKIGFNDRSVNDQTKKIYICPFTGKAFGDNTHPDPQDAIYDWVSKCPENTERAGGLKAKRFFISEDSEVIKNYIPKEKAQKATISKTVFSSSLNGKLYNSKEAVLDDFKRHYVKKMSLIEVQNQDRYEIEEHFLTFLQSQLEEDKITSFVEMLAEDEDFLPFVESWLESDEAETDEAETLKE